MDNVYVIRATENVEVRKLIFFIVTCLWLVELVVCMSLAHTKPFYGNHIWFMQYIINFLIMFVVTTAISAKIMFYIIAGFGWALMGHQQHHQHAPVIDQESLEEEEAT